MQIYEIQLNLNEEECAEIVSNQFQTSIVHLNGEFWSWKYVF